MPLQSSFVFKNFILATEFTISKKHITCYKEQIYLVFLLFQGSDPQFGGNNIFNTQLREASTDCN